MYRVTMILCLLIMGLSLNGCDNFMNKGTPTQSVYTYQVGDTIQHVGGTVGVVSKRRINRRTDLPEYLLRYIAADGKCYDWFYDYELGGAQR